MEEPYVFDGDDRLAGKDLEESNLLLGEQLRFQTTDRDTTNRLSIAYQRNGARHTIAIFMGYIVAEGELRFCARFMMNRLHWVSVDDRAAGDGIPIQYEGFTHGEYGYVSKVRGDEHPVPLHHIDDCIRRIGKLGGIPGNDIQNGLNIGWRTRNYF